MIADQYEDRGDWGPYDTNGNDLDDYWENNDVQRLISSDAEVLGIDNRGLVVFYDQVTKEVFYIKLTVEGNLDFFNAKDMFGGELEQHLKVVKERYGVFRWLDRDVKQRLG